MPIETAYVQRYGNNNKEYTGYALDELYTKSNNLENVNVKKTIWEEITSKGIDGTVETFNGETAIDTTIWETIPYNAEAKKIHTDGSYTGEDVYTASGTHIKAVIDTNGDYLLSGTPDPSEYPRYAIVYSRKGTLKEFGNEGIPSTNIIDTYEMSPMTRVVSETEIRPRNDGDDFNLLTGGLKDNDVTTAVYLGDSENISIDNDLNSASILGASNDLIQCEVDKHQSGVVEWLGTGDYYSIDGSKFTVLRGGVGRVVGKIVNWVASEVTGNLTANFTNYICVNSDGNLEIVTSRATAFSDGYPLFEVYYDGSSSSVVREDHNYSFTSVISNEFHLLIGTVIHPYGDTPIIGANITKVATGTGASVNDRKIKIVGSAELNDHGVCTIIPDSSGSAISINWFYTDTSGYWKKYATQEEAVMYYNNLGTPTALANGKYGNWRLYASKDDKNSSLPKYFAVMGDDEFNNIGHAIGQIEDGEVPVASGELWKLELAQLGFITVLQNASGGYIYSLTIEKQISGYDVSGAVISSTAGGTFTDTLNFDRVLDSGDSTVQLALDSLDDAVAIDDDVVHKTGPESIAGAKTFVDGISANKGVESPYAIFEDQKTSGTDGGSFSSGSWVTRVLNTTVYENDPNDEISISSNQITLGSGVYEIYANAPAYRVNEHKTRLYQTSGTPAVLVYGSSVRSSESYYGNVSSIIKTVLTLDSTTTFELQHRCNNSQSTNGLGIASPSAWSATEVYARLSVKKIAPYSVPI